ncbi:MAG: hypothetical protein HYT48_01940 [Candidatus Vogelbacteria bacterium]|nr:hypothetical protein [Candidatus Vogelbacteria bacterium]
MTWAKFSIVCVCVSCLASSCPDNQPVVNPPPTDQPPTDPGTTSPPAPKPTVDLKINDSDGPLTLLAPATLTLSWTSTNATTVTASGGWTGNKVLTDSVVISNLASGVYSYALSATGAGGTAMDTVKVTVNLTPPPPPPPVQYQLTVVIQGQGTVSPNGGQFDQGTTVILTATAQTGWHFDHWSGALTGSVNPTSLQMTLNKTVTAVFVENPLPPAPTIDLKINGSNGPLTLVAPATLTLSWTSTNATTATASGDWTGNKAVTDSTTISDLGAGTYSYSIQVIGDGGTATDTVKVTVNPPAPTVDLKINDSNGPLTLVAPATFTVSWISSNATKVVASGDWTDLYVAVEKSLSGSEVVTIDQISDAYDYKHSQDYYFQIEADGPGGVVRDYVELTINQPYFTSSQVGDIFQVNYGFGTDFPQVAAWHLDSGYLRQVPNRESGWGPSVIIPPTYWELCYLPISWAEMPSPIPPDQTNTRFTSLVCMGNKIFALVYYGQPASKLLLVSDDVGQTWQQLLSGDSNVNGSTLLSFWGIAVDGDHLYIATTSGLLVSADEGRTFQWSFRWGWDPTISVSFAQGYGWITVGSWGSLSGVLRQLPNGLWSQDHNPPWSGWGKVFADYDDPANTAYVSSGYRTRDAGQTWSKRSPNDESTIFTGKLGGQAIVCSTESYSLDHGDTWQPLGNRLNYPLASGPDGQTLFASYHGLPSPRVVSVGLLGGPWYPLGLVDSSVSSNPYLTTGLGKIWVSVGDKLFAANLSDIVQTPVLRQGGQIKIGGVFGYHKRLLIDFSAALSNLDMSGRLDFSPPTKDGFTVTVTGSVIGNVILADKPGEAFKPVMISTMNEPPNWDSVNCFIGEAVFPFPASGWIVTPPVMASKFGVRGGTSPWKTNSPTVEIVFDSPAPVTGWVTPSTDPNDDNVGVWAGYDQLVPSWQYTITARPATSP